MGSGFQVFWFPGFCRFCRFLLVFGVETGTITCSSPQNRLVEIKLEGGITDALDSDVLHPPIILTISHTQLLRYCYTILQQKPRSCAWQLVRMRKPFSSI